MNHPVVVGVDGSRAGMTAAWWAAREAAVRRLPLLLFHSWTTQPLNVPIAQQAHNKQRYGHEVLQRAEAELLHRYGDLSLTTKLVSDPAAQALVDLSKDTALLVLGSRGHGSLASFLLGSISLHVLGLAQCPTVTVRAGDPAAEAGWGHAAVPDGGEIVVGVQEPGPAADPLLEFAFTSAQLHGARVHAVHALPVSAVVHQHAMAAGLTFGRYEAEERIRLTATLAPWREKFPDVPVAEMVTTGPAGQVLLSAATHGQLVVVGRRGHPSRLTWKLGPVAHAALHHAPCPVAVIPHA
ncbi:universal stress protein [Streptomyces luteolifulvus]|uniref:Universal stress protein n=1 Tax=Streptomyces luteolifulvus TaxID=2615112 RepID=A0A6H9UP39_9ACTN|nr:universal stress protein [Streptomyces luteolifulvus]KAB1139856.1 universal stress protein [Streptomyces luteolifulvus]